ncbi:MAG: hypothetical protein E6K84_09250 [Thaumarchaeota archaeon]|nr:MAG: hypothetical protein E6K84_09250 [Nitrososphaerota archaeon]
MPASRRAILRAMPSANPTLLGPVLGIEVKGPTELITQGKRMELKAIKRVTGIHLAPKYLVVVYRDESGRKAIITAYFTCSLKKVKGDVVWKA